jgi:hypothetical protein
VPTTTAQAARIVALQARCSPEAALYLIAQRSKLTGMTTTQIATEVIARSATFGAH